MIIHIVYFSIFEISSNESLNALINRNVNKHCNKINEKAVLTIEKFSVIGYQIVSHLCDGHIKNCIIHELLIIFVITKEINVVPQTIEGH